MHKLLIKRLSCGGYIVIASEEAIYANAYVSKMKICSKFHFPVNTLIPGNTVYTVVYKVKFSFEDSKFFVIPRLFEAENCFFYRPL